MKRFSIFVLLISLLAVQAIGQESIVEKPASQDVAQQQTSVQRLAKMSKFARAVRRAAWSEFRAGKITRRERILITSATWSPSMLEEIQPAMVAQLGATRQQMIADGIEGIEEAVPVNDQGHLVPTAINWEGLSAFLREWVPIILQILRDFGVV